MEDLKTLGSYGKLKHAIEIMVQGEKNIFPEDFQNEKKEIENEGYAYLTNLVKCFLLYNQIIPLIKFPPAEEWEPVDSEGFDYEVEFEFLGDKYGGYFSAYLEDSFEEQAAGIILNKMGEELHREDEMEEETER